MRLDVVIVVYRPRLVELQAGLRAIAQAITPGSDVTVHLWHNDEGPQATPGLDAAIEQLRASSVGVRIGGARGNLGFGRAINAVLPDVASPHLLLLNQDAIPEPGALQRLWECAREDHDQVAAWEMRQIPYEHPKDYDPVSCDTGWCSGAAVLLRTQALRDVQGFEPRFFMYCEDVDLSWRLRCAGWRLRYQPRCAVVHRTYSEPGEIKPLAALRGRYANLCLRARYAGRRHVVDAMRQLLCEVKGQPVFPGWRRGLLKASLDFAVDYAYFRRTRKAAPGFQPCFRDWDYEQRREGSFHVFRSQEERLDHPLPPVSVVVRVSGCAPDLNAWLTTLRSQTHQAAQLVLVHTDPDMPSPSLVDQADLRNITWVAAAPTAPLSEIAKQHAHADWVMLSDDLQHRLYADHIEVLLQAALDANANAACGMSWHIHAPVRQAHEAHRLNVDRHVSSDPPASWPSPLVRRAALSTHWQEHLLPVNKVTSLRYADDSARVTASR